MAYCAECGAEFGGGIRHCPECQVDLLDELEEPILYDSQVENLVLIRESMTSDEARKIKDFLQTNGILCVVETSGQPKSPATPGKTNILVNQKDAQRSEQLVRTQFG